MAQVIDNVRLLQRQLDSAEQRRSQLRNAIDDADLALPAWAVEPLRAVGLTANEILSARRRPSEESVAAMERQLAEVDAEIEAIERRLERYETHNIEGVLELANICAERLRETTSVDPEDPFYDQADARTLVLLDNVVHNLERLTERVALRQAG